MEQNHPCEVGPSPARYPRWQILPPRKMVLCYETSRKICRSSSGRLNETVIRDSKDPSSPREMGSAGLFLDAI